MKKDYLKPDVEYIDFVTEAIAYVAGEGSNPFGGEDEF